jgi:Asp-tRNA(Asn)/Glu-tRNA(Gln) amidotransferase A subunit family amidase
MDFKNLSLIELSELVSSGKATSQEIYTYFLERTKKYNEELNAFNTLPLDIDSANGLPIAVKDAFCEK